MAAPAPPRPDLAHSQPPPRRNGSGRWVVALAIVVVMGLMTTAVIVATARDHSSPAVAVPMLPPQRSPSMPIVLGPAPSPTVSAPRIDLQLGGFGDLVMDGEHRHVFVSGGKMSDVIVVLDFNGEVVRRLTGEPGASGMVIHGSILYVALWNADRVARIDTSTLRTLHPVDVRPANRPYQLAWAGNRLYVAYGECAGGLDDGVVSVDPSSGRVTRFAADSFSHRCPTVMASSRLPNRLFEWGLVPPGAIEYDVSGKRLRRIASVSMAVFGSGNAVVSPDGRFLLVAGGGVQVQSFSSATLRSSGTNYVATTSVGGVDMTVGPHSKVVVGSYPSSGGDVWVYQAGNPRPYTTFDLGHGLADGVYDGGVAFAPNGDRVFAVTGNLGNNKGTEALLRVIRL